jgi:MHS family proline/betaine transporter-like MFS transporter
MVFLVERAPDGRRGLMGALAASGATGGILLGSAVGAGFAASMSDATLEGWGWRVPFLLGLVVGIARLPSAPACAGYRAGGAAQTRSHR